MAISAINFVQENTGSDSEANSDVEDEPNYYQPISAVDDEDSVQQEDDEIQTESNGDSAIFSNCRPPVSERPGLANGNAGATTDLKEEDEEEEEEEREVEASESAISRAFREDENRRSAPLPVENATRVMNAMRGISFPGSTPDWANQVPEDRWIDQLRRLRPLQSPSTATTTNTSTAAAASQN